MSDISAMEPCFLILVADDSSDDHFLIERAIKKAKTNGKIVYVESFEDSIRYLEGQGEFSDRTRFPYPQLVVSDASMPSQLGGFDILYWLREHVEAAPVPVIVCSGNLNPEFIQKAYQLGANSYFAKPSIHGELETFFEAFFRYWALVKPPVVPETPRG